MKGCNMKERKQEAEPGFFDIDITRLDEEWVKQPKITFKYCKEYERVKIELEEVQTDLDVIAAQIIKVIRKNPKRFGLPVPTTETAINKTVITKSKYKETLKKVRDKQYKLGLLRATVKALDHRKAALERLVSLHGQAYFATPVANDEDGREYIKSKQRKRIASRKTAIGNKNGKNKGRNNKT